MTVSQSGAGLATAGYLFIDVAPAGGPGSGGEAYAGCRGFAGTIEQEGSVNPVRAAYRVGDGSHIFLHGGFPKASEYSRVSAHRHVAKCRDA